MMIGEASGLVKPYRPRRRAVNAQCPLFRFNWWSGKRISVRHHPIRCAVGASGSTEAMLYWERARSFERDAGAAAGLVSHFGVALLRGAGGRSRPVR